MGYTEAAKKATYKQRNEKLDRLEIYIPKGEKELIKDHVIKTGESVSSFVYRAIKEAIEKDNAIQETQE